MLGRMLLTLSFLTMLLSCSNQTENFSGDEYGKVTTISSKGIENVENFKMFIQEIKEGINSSIRIIKITKEGDPVYHDLVYKEEKIFYKYDNTEDREGNKLVLETVCSGITNSKDIKNDNVTYYLDGCADNRLTGFKITLDSE
ncbi:hypothetical protein JCM10914A_51450 [Paenibacillus sp. JCM 10914]|uniref:DUF4362 domain-containing protein n=1 Tax=Paenibacillus sp. JCM 10914 TaxID=1236974 RepID=UPI00056273A1|nr:DUF4362 domain-containing protein [Paenibacillus sp. JCM 10914]